MIRVGFDPESSGLSFVAVEKTSCGGRVVESGRIALKEGRDASEMRELASQIQSLLDRLRPSSIMVKAKPENGQMRAGSKTFRMETVIMICSAAPVVFVPSAKLKAVNGQDDLFAYLQDAWRCAVITEEQIRAKAARTKSRAP